MSKKVEIWGIYPPPIGGVSIHIKRLIHQLNNISRIELLDFIPKKIYPNDFVKPIKYPILVAIKLLFEKKRIIHIEQFSYLIFITIIILGWRHKIGITIHNQRSVKIQHPLKKLICKLFFKKCSFIIMNDANFSKQFSLFYNIDMDKIHILPAFLSPDHSEKRGLPDSVLLFRKQHKFLLSSTAYRLRKDCGVDVYGVDMLLPLVRKLRDSGIDAGLLFLLPEIGDSQYYREIKKTIECLNILDHVLIVEGKNDNGFEFWGVSDLFVRATITDMEGISVKESLCQGVHVIASDVCARPKECILYKSRDEDDLYEKIVDYYKSGKCKVKIEYSNYVDVAIETFKIYESLS